MQIPAICIPGTQKRGWGRGVWKAAYLCWVDFSHSPVPGLQWGLLHPGLHQHALILALLVQPLRAVKHIPDVCCQVQHLNTPALEPYNSES